MRYLLCTLLILALAFGPLYSQTYKEQWKVLHTQNDTLGELALLQKWETAQSNDAELYVAWFNYYVVRARHEVVELGNNPQGKDALTITDSSQQTVGYIYDNPYFDPALLEKGFQYINKGIALYPNRLDMIFGKIYMLGQLGSYDSFTREIIRVVNSSAKNKNEWTWADNKPLKKAKDFMLTTVTDYVVQLYNAGNDSLVENMKQITEAVLKYYPNHVPSLSNLSVVYLIHNDLDKALEVLLKSEKLAPKDFIVLNNIAQTYKRKGNKEKAIEYYRKTLKYGDDDAKAVAKNEIDELSKK